MGHPYLPDYIRKARYSELYSCIYTTDGIRTRVSPQTQMPYHLATVAPPLVMASTLNVSFQHELAPRVKPLLHADSHLKFTAVSSDKVSTKHLMTNQMY